MSPADVLASFGRYLGEFLSDPAGRGRFNEIFSGMDEAPFRKALSRGRGALVLSPHFANWEAAGIALAEYGFPASLLVRPLGNPSLDSLLNRLRRGVGVVPGNRLREALAALASNRLLATAADEFAEKGPEVIFFGRRTRLPRGVFDLAGRAGAPIIAASAIREKDGRLRIIAYDPVDPGEKAPGMIAERLEEIIRRDPSQWILLSERFPGSSPRASRRSRS